MLANSSAAIGERAMRSRVFMTTGCAGGPTPACAGRRPGGRRGLAPFSLERSMLLAQALDLLQDLLELVLGAAELAGQARDVAPPGEPQVAPHEVHRRRTPIRVSATTFSVAIASSSPNDSRETTRSAAFATRDSASS